jgi:hypothetical protein
MTISSGSRLRRFSRMRKFAVKQPADGSRRLLWPSALAIALIGAALAVSGSAMDERPERPDEFRGPLELPQAELIRFVKRGFRGRTDFERRNVPLREFVPAGPPRNGIPSIDAPGFVAVERADLFLADREPVAVVERRDEVHAYPLRIMVWHEIVNDDIAGVPVALTYCPLCNSTVAFRRELGGRKLKFGTTGVIRNSDLVMYDRQTYSWWQQLTGDAVAGELTGARLRVLPSPILSWRALRRAHPGARVLAQPTDRERPYGHTPYVGYESGNDPYLFRGRSDPRLAPMERVIAIAARRGTAIAYPFARLRAEAPINDEVARRPVALFFDPAVASAVDSARIPDGRGVGSAGVFSRIEGGRTLEFEPGPDRATFRDAQTGSIWEVSGRAVAGPLAGHRLARLQHHDQFWFALAAFFEDVEIRR